MRYQIKRTYFWSPNVAYSVGLMASDGCLSSDNRHIIFVSKDMEQVKNFSKSISKDIKISAHNDTVKNHIAYRVQFSDTGYYDFLIGVGLTSRKSKTIGSLKIPDKYYVHFLRGVFDGDGTTYAYYDHRWKNSYMYYTGFTSASKPFLEYLMVKNTKIINTLGKSIRSGNGAYSLVYGKRDSYKLYCAIYKEEDCLYLSRKKIKLDSFIKQDNGDIIPCNARVL